jgi:tryptophan synthase alpha chain
VARVADAAVVGSAVVNRIAAEIGGDGKPGPRAAAAALELVESLAAGVRGARA